MTFDKEVTRFTSRAKVQIKRERDHNLRTSTSSVEESPSDGSRFAFGNTKTGMSLLLAYSAPPQSGIDEYKKVLLTVFQKHTNRNSESMHTTQNRPLQIKNQHIHRN